MFSWFILLKDLGPPPQKKKTPPGVKPCGKPLVDHVRHGKISAWWSCDAVSFKDRQKQARSDKVICHQSSSSSSSIIIIIIIIVIVIVIVIVIIIPEDISKYARISIVVWLNLWENSRAIQFWRHPYISYMICFLMIEIWANYKKSGKSKPGIWISSSLESRQSHLVPTQPIES